MRALLFSTLCVLTLLAPTFASGGPVPPGCHDNTQRAVASANGFYVFHLGLTGIELWEESNGIDGLQRSPSWCDGREPIPRDTCLKHSENNGMIQCLVELLL